MRGPAPYRLVQAYEPMSEQTNNNLVSILLSVPQVQQLCQGRHLAAAAGVTQSHEAVLCLGSAYLVQILTCSHTITKQQALKQQTHTLWTWGNISSP